MKLRIVSLSVVAALVGLALASSFTVQVVATANEGAAQEVASDLRQRGLPAYVAAGNGLFRVRLGCFSARADAEAVARQAGAWGTQSFIVVPTGGLLPDSATCVNSDVGFVKPADWRLIEGEAIPTFEVRLVGTPASVSYHPSRGWWVHQVGEPIAVPDGEGGKGEFQMADGTAEPFVAWNDGSSSTLVCPGTLLTTVGSAAIVENNHTVRACQLAGAGGDRP